ncbi:hypothetical protein Lser_V15G34485 [Lactuca serriola]
MGPTFMTCSCTGKLQITYTVRKFNGIAIHWWNALGKTISPNNPLQLTWEEFLTHLKRIFSSTENTLELENSLLTLKKGSMIVDEYTNTFIEKMEFSLHVVPDELFKIDRYSKGLPWEYFVLIKQAYTFESVMWAARLVEDMIKRRVADKNEVGKKLKGEGLLRSDKKSKISSSDPKSWGNNESNWCNKCMKKHDGQCKGEETFYRCGRPGHYSNECRYNVRACFECREERHVMKNCPKIKEVTK